MISNRYRQFFCKKKILTSLTVLSLLGLQFQMPVLAEDTANEIRKASISDTQENIAEISQIEDQDVEIFTESEMASEEISTEFQNSEKTLADEPDSQHQAKLVEKDIPSTEVSPAPKGSEETLAEKLDSQHQAKLVEKNISSTEVLSASKDSEETLVDEPDSLFQHRALERASHKSEVFTLDEYKRSSATELAALVRQGSVTPEQLIDMAAEVISETNPDLNGVISLRLDKAREELASMEDNNQPFYGVPILAKGLGHTVEGGQNTNGLEFLKDDVSKRTGRYIKALQKAGFVVIGQTSFPQFGWINVTNSDLYGDTRNPWNLDHNPGGSSGGSAAAVTVGQVPIATTSDAGGSTRIPSSFSSLIGLHPTSGVLEGNSKGQTSHFSVTKTMEDAHRLFDVLLKEKYVNHINNQPLDTSIPIAYSLKTPAGTPIDLEAVQAVKNAVHFLQEKGFNTVEVDYPVDGKAMMENYYVNAANTSKMVNFLAQNKLGRPLEKDDVELLTWALYQTSQDISRQDVKKAKENIQTFKDTMDAFYQKYPIFLTPTTAYPAPAADYNHIPEELKEQMEDMSNLNKQEKLDLIYQQWLPAWTKTPYTQLANLTETPSLSLPTHLTSEGLPIGILFGSARYNDKLLLQIGDLFEQEEKFQLFYRTIEETEEVCIPFKRNYIANAHMRDGEYYTMQKGQNGSIINKYLVSYEGNKPIKRHLTSQKRLLSTPEIIYYGTLVDQTDEDVKKSQSLQPLSDSNMASIDEKVSNIKIINDNDNQAQVDESQPTYPSRVPTVGSPNRPIQQTQLPHTGDSSISINILGIIYIFIGGIFFNKKNIH